MPARAVLAALLLVCLSAGRAAPQPSVRTAALVRLLDDRSARQLAKRPQLDWRRPASADSPAERADGADQAQRAERAEQAEQAEEAERALDRTGSALAQQFMRSSRAGRHKYDVPQIECPISESGMERFACPTQDHLGRYRCIDGHMLCDGYTACPGGEDEDRQNCMFYKMTKTHLNVLAEALLKWVRGR